MIEKMKDLIRERDTCVLATVSGGNPHCSLMSYAADPECREIYMVTQRQTKKYRNLEENATVSLLIDTRAGAGKEEIKALTIGGVFQRIEDAEKKDRVRRSLLERHPALNFFIDDPEAEVFAVRVKSLQLLEGIRDATFIEVD